MGNRGLDGVAYCKVKRYETKRKVMLQMHCKKVLHVYCLIYLYFTGTNSPVVPAGAISLSCFTTSSLLDCFALCARQRINRLVPGSGCSSESRSSCKESINWSTTSLESHGCDIIVSMALLGRAITFSSIPVKETNFNNTSTILSNNQPHILHSVFSFVFLEPPESSSSWLLII